MSPTNSIEFSLPGLPPSINAIYNIIWYRREVALKPEVCKWILQAKVAIPRWKVKRDTAFKIQLDYYSDKWFTKEGKLRRIDATNLEKVVIDVIAAKLGFDDCRIVERVCRKRISGGKGEYVTVRIEEVGGIE